jgi:hypothetical protein
MHAILRDSTAQSLDEQITEMILTFKVVTATNVFIRVVVSNSSATSEREDVEH